MSLNYIPENYLECSSKTGIGMPGHMQNLHEWEGLWVAERNLSGVIEQLVS